MSYQYSPGTGQTPSGRDQHYSAAVPAYNNKVVKQFAIMTVVWGVVGMLVGVIIAAQLVWPELNVGPWLHFGRHGYSVGIYCGAGFRRRLVSAYAHRPEGMEFPGQLPGGCCRSR